MALPAFRVAKTLHGGPAATLSYEAGGAVTVGSLVRVAAGDGQVDEIGAGDDITNILGIALTAADAAGDDICVALAVPETIFSGACAGSTTVVQADVGDFRSIDTDGVDADTAAPTNEAVRIVGIDATDTNRCLFQFLDADSQAQDLESV